MSGPVSLALTACLPTELLTFILQQSFHTSVIICSTRDNFLSALLKNTTYSVPWLETNRSLHISVDQPDPPSGEQSTPEEDNETTQGSLRHPLLVPTLQQIASSRHTHLAFIPTITHLRAYLTVFPSASSSAAQSLAQMPYSDKNSADSSLLLVYGLVEAHRGTSEWSTQGLGNTLAALVEAGVRSGKRVVIVEERQEDELENEVETGLEEINSSGEQARTESERPQARRVLGLWSEKLPILSGSTRRVGADIEYAGRTVEVGTVLRRWFKFGKGNWDDEPTEE
jgi:hypothetical protein